MKRFFGLAMTILLLCANNAGSSIFAQDSTLAGTPLPNPLAGSASVPDADPQFALSLLDEYFKGNEVSRIKSGVILTSVGSGILLLGGAAAGYAFLAPSSSFTDSNEQMMARGFTAGTAGLGILVGGIGLVTLGQPKDKYLTRYAYLYSENDPVVQEALAYGIMKDIAGEAKRSRITGGIIGVVTPLAVLGGQAILAGVSNDWEGFKNNSLSTMQWTLPNMVSGLVMLLGGSSKGERMLETYLVTSSAYAVKNK